MIYASNEEIDASNTTLKADADLMIVLRIKSVVAAETTESEPIDDDQVPSVAAPQLDMHGHAPLPSGMCLFMGHDFLSL